MAKELTTNEEVKKGGTKTEGSSDPSKKGVGRSFRGTVVSAKMKDTVAVLVTRYVKHPKYKKYQVRSKKFLAHDAGNTRKEGEAVTIRETRPMSKRKHFEVILDSK